MTLTIKLALLGILSSWSPLFAQTQPAPSTPPKVERVWLTYRTNDPDHTIINWETSQPAPSVVRYGPTPDCASRVESRAISSAVGSGSYLSIRHHVEIETKTPDTLWHYAIGETTEANPVHTFKGTPTQELRVAVVGDWGYAPGRDLTALKKDDVHLIITAGDNVPSLHEKGAEGAKAYSKFIDENQALLATTPLLPVLGNHDKETRTRGPGPKPPAEPVYDVNATVYRDFFELPGDEWKWHFDIPAFSVRFIALDIQHIGDFGTHWQSCHPFEATSEQYLWFQKLMSETRSDYVFSIINEKQTSLYGATKDKGLWHQQFVRGSALITGFGYFAERAELKGGLPYFNTCLKGDGTVYKDPASQFLASQDHYLLLTFQKASPTMKAQFKNLKGEVLDTRDIARRPVP